MTDAWAARLVWFIVNFMTLSNKKRGFFLPTANRSISMGKFRSPAACKQQRTDKGGTKKVYVLWHFARRLTIIAHSTTERTFISTSPSKHNEQCTNNVRIRRGSHWRHTQRFFSKANFTPVVFIKLPPQIDFMKTNVITDCVASAFNRLSVLGKMFYMFVHDARWKCE